jgi:20S proteasome alpha/beta subunit
MDVTDEAIDLAIAALDEAAKRDDGSSGAPAAIADIEPEDEADVDRLVDEIVAFIQARMGNAMVAA